MQEIECVLEPLFNLVASFDCAKFANLATTSSGFVYYAKDTYIIGDKRNHFLLNNAKITSLVIV